MRAACPKRCSAPAASWDAMISLPPGWKRSTGCCAAACSPNAWIQWPIGEGRPDGGSFDEAGFYWTALFDGGRVARLSPDGDVVEEVAMPITRPTMIVFGGDDRRTAYVTSARVNGERQSGGIFSFRVETPGVPEWPFG